MPRGSAADGWDVAEVNGADAFMAVFGLSRRCPHGANSTPATCSQCIGAVPKLVTIQGSDVLVDGVHVRTVDHEDEMQRYYARRGGKR